MTGIGRFEGSGNGHVAEGSFLAAKLCADVHQHRILIQRLGSRIL